MKKIGVILLVTGLLLGSIAGIALAFGGGNGEEEYIPEDNGVFYEDDGIIEDEAVFGDESNLEDNDVFIEEDYLGEYEMAVVPDYFSITGIVESVEEVDDTIHVTIEDVYGNPAVLVLSDDTVYLFDTEFEIGDTITGWYVTDAPMILIWPAQYNIAVLAAGAPEDSNITVDRFYTMEDNDDGLMLSVDGMFAFRTDNDTKITLANGDDYTGDILEGKRIVVIYDFSTRSIPEIATARWLIILEDEMF